MRAPEPVTHVEPSTGVRLEPLTAARLAERLAERLARGARDVEDRHP
jgi:hypothetical protein